MAKPKRGARAQLKARAKGQARKTRLGAQGKVVGKFAWQANRIARDLQTAYLGLTSGTPRHIADARSLLEIYLKTAVFWISMDFVDRIKQWINQEKPETRHIKWLNDTYDAAKSTGDTQPDDQDARWLWKGRTARVLFYAGRYKRARKRFERARKRVKADFSKVSDPNNLTYAHDTRATEAEFLVYMGYPSVALSRLDEIPIGSRKGWHEWVRAWAWHQRGFVERVTFGDFPGNDPTLPGPPPKYGDKKSWYVRSNELLETLRNGDQLSAAEKLDTFLLTAANYGALSRLGDAGAKQEAVDALGKFQAAGGESNNAHWSWKKEQRGRFALRAFPGEGPSEDAVKDWRCAYQGHYRDNLAEAGLPPLYEADDGDLGNDDEAALDDDDTIE